MILLWLVLLLIFLSLLVIGLYAFYIAYRLYHPYTKNRRRVNLQEMNANSLRLPAAPGIELDALLLSAGDSRRVAVITHELGAVKESKLKLARRLVKAGFNVLLFDLRNHGESSRDYSLGPMSEKFTDDVAVALRYVHENLPAIDNINLIAFSFSTFPALYIINRQLKQPDTIVVDSGPSATISDLYGKFLDDLGRFLVPSVLRLPVLLPLFKFFFQFFGTRMLSTRWPPDWSGLRSRVLFVVNAEDAIFSQSQIMAVADQVPNKEVWVCPESAHLQAQRSDPIGYEQTLLNFLNSQTGARHDA
ncbi:MAG: alpha/beta fold hydrolase [Pseudomonadota bacterium]